jgi:hypothetical protein
MLVYYSNMSNILLEKAKSHISLITNKGHLGPKGCGSVLECLRSIHEDLQSLTPPKKIK